MIAQGVGAVGFLVALICKYAVNEVILGFLLSLALLLAASIMEICFLRRAAIRWDEALDEEMRRRHQNGITRIGTNTFFVLWTALGCHLPYFLLRLDSGGVAFFVNLLCGISIAAAFLLVGFLAFRFWIRPALLKKQFLYFDEKTLKIEQNKQVLLKKVTIFALCALIICMILSALALEALPLLFRERKFYERDAFIDFMETNGSVYGVSRHTVRGTDGEELFTFRWVNDDVESFLVNPLSEDRLPITVKMELGSPSTMRLSHILVIALEWMAALSVFAAAAFYLYKARKYR